jgi:hypothetical protein
VYMLLGLLKKGHSGSYMKAFCLIFISLWSLYQIT